MQSSIRKIVLGAAIFLVSCAAAIVGYLLAGWTLLEAVYMVTITIFGVGYGEVRPVNDPALRVFTMGVIIAGCTSSIYVMGGFVQMIAAGELNRFLGARRMTKGIEKLTGHVIVCGYGRVGQMLSRELTAYGQSFLVIDTDQERLQEAEAAGLFVLVGDATQEQTLASARIADARVLATVLPNDASNVFITLTARELNEDIEIIARGESAATERKLLRSGATRVVLPAAIGASRIARLITRPTAEELLSNSLQQQTLNDDLDQLGLRMHDLPVPDGSEFRDTRLEQVSCGTEIQCVIIAVRSAEGQVLQNPSADYLLQPGDVLIVLTHGSADLKLRTSASRSKIVYRGASV